MPSQSINLIFNVAKATNSYFKDHTTERRNS